MPDCRSYLYFTVIIHYIPLIKQYFIANNVTKEAADQVEIPHTELSAEALRGVLESFVLREGTDYGAREYSLDEKVAHVMRQLERGDARIMFDPATETVGIVVRAAARAPRR
jgi:uncharacterized protein YheU (UPF0270 family)